VQVVQPAQEEQVGDLLDHLQRVGDAAGPEGVPDLVDLALDVAGDHLEGLHREQQRTPAGKLPIIMPEVLQRQVDIGDAFGRHRLDQVFHQRRLESDLRKDALQVADGQLLAAVHLRKVHGQGVQILDTECRKVEQLRELIHRAAGGAHHCREGILRGAGEHGGDLALALLQHGAQGGDDVPAIRQFAERLHFVEHQQHLLAGLCGQAGGERVVRSWSRK
jgi:hypothetical protein